ncbi:hypothetical protein K260102G11_02370 [Bacteroides uniformis]|jgi:hypothetical protein|uniref:hypothetical protein n=3 Tax=Bacteroidaceae TaxID=815 RepID=UPI000E7348A5|nr:hypothetical protein [Phocaeicola sartorii]RJV23111.1 hypothetical protein DWY41_18690 [Bacteroides sp. AF25-17LB]RJV23388.1 hypothetical protein DWY57_19195 [Bacteroides sp. AF25-5LB]
MDFNNRKEILFIFLIKYLISMNHNLRVSNGTSELEVNVSLEKNIASITENVIVVGQGSGMSFCAEQILLFMRNFNQQQITSIHK